MTKYVAKPIEVDAFQYGKDELPKWFKKVRHSLPAIPLNTIVVKTNSNDIEYYTIHKFKELFHTVDESKDLDGDGTLDTREKAIASETIKIKTKGKPSDEGGYTPVKEPETKTSMDKIREERDKNLTPQQKAAITRAKNKAKKAKEKEGK